jgi:hypothetical protein
VLNDFATIDFDELEVIDDRLPPVAQNGESLTGPVYRATLRLTTPADLVSHYDPDDPEVRKNRLAWDEMTAEYYFYCDSSAPLMSMAPGREQHRLKGHDIRVIDNDADAKQRVFVEWRQIPDEEWGMADGIGTKAAERVCKRVRTLSEGG